MQLEYAPFKSVDLLMVFCLYACLFFKFPFQWLWVVAQALVIFKSSNSGDKISMYPKETIRAMYRGLV